MRKESESRIWRLELKYCERCGALWLRRAGGEDSYCKGCFVEMERLPRAKGPRKDRRAAHRNRRKGKRGKSRPGDREGVSQCQSECVHEGAA